MHTRSCKCDRCINDVRGNNIFEEPMTKKRKISKKNDENPTLLPPQSPASNTSETPKSPASSTEPASWESLTPSPAPPTADPTPLIIGNQNNFEVNTSCDNVFLITSMISYVRNCMNAQIVNSQEKIFTPEQIEMMKLSYNLIK